MDEDSPAPALVVVVGAGGFKGEDRGGKIPGSAVAVRHNVTNVAMVNSILIKYNAVMG